MVTRLHVVSKTLAAGPRWYVYAWRGGPCIHVADGARPAITPGLLAAAIAARQSSPDSHQPFAGTFEAIIAAYRQSPEFERLADSTKRDYRLWLDRASAKFGPAPLGAFDDRRMRGEIVAWRDRWRAQPRTADKASVTMATLLGWALQRGMVAINVAAGIPQLHRVNKADQVWERRHLRAFANAPKHLRDALKIALFTGLRLGDLVRLDWANVGKDAIVLETRKRKGRAVIPITATLRRLLDRRDWRTGTVLRNSRGQPWTDSGLGSVFQKARPAGFDRTMHDLRGTYVTWLATEGLTDEQISRIVGWTARRVSEVRSRYVDETRVVISLVEHLNARRTVNQV